MIEMYIINNILSIYESKEWQIFIAFLYIRIRMNHNFYFTFPWRFQADISAAKTSVHCSAFARTRNLRPACFCALGPI